VVSYLCRPRVYVDLYSRVLGPWGFDADLTVTVTVRSCSLHLREHHCHTVKNFSDNGGSFEILGSLKLFIN
jgi:hypothetical protein